MSVDKNKDKHEEVSAVSVKKRNKDAMKKFTARARPTATLYPARQKGKKATCGGCRVNT